jgi:hypothetical protein
MSKNNQVASVVITLQEETALPDATVRQANRDTDFTKGDATDPYNYVTLQQGDQRIVVGQRELRKALEALFAILQ